MSVENPNPVMTAKTMPTRAWVFTIDGEATLGDRMITVSTDANNEDDEDIDLT